MKSVLRVVIVTLLLGAAAGCATVPQESAMEWMQRQPMRSDP